MHSWKHRQERGHWHFKKAFYFNNSSFRRAQQNWCQGRRGQHTGNPPFELNFGVSENSDFSLPARTAVLMNNFIWSRFFPGHNLHGSDSAAVTPALHHLYLFSSSSSLVVVHATWPLILQQLQQTKIKV